RAGRAARAAGRAARGLRHPRQPRLPRGGELIAAKLAAAGPVVLRNAAVRLVAPAAPLLADRIRRRPARPRRPRGRGGGGAGGAGLRGQAGKFLLAGPRRAGGAAVPPSTSLIEGSSAPVRAFSRAP